MQLGVDNGCVLCPRRCGRERPQGFCGAPAEPEVASVCVHTGEEPPLNPIINVFFAHCNLQCVYCQNWQISGRGAADGGCGTAMTVDAIADHICTLATDHSPQTTSPLLGLVTAAHYASHIPSLVEAVHRRGLFPTVVYNSGGYERLETLRLLEGFVDIYLPDFKYMDASLAESYSHAPDYPKVATAAVREMIRQVGLGLKTDDNGMAFRGIVVRHLVLPGHVGNSFRVLDTLSTLGVSSYAPASLHLSLMAQYFPPRPGLPTPLDRTVSPEEYAAVTAYAAKLGFVRGWQQELSSQDTYRPDFTRKGNPFNAATL